MDKIWLKFVYIYLQNGKFKIENVKKHIFMQRYGQHLYKLKSNFIQTSVRSAS
jgi:hypothetical protein